ncbi:MAG: cyanophycinase [Erythrobacter sp.]
MRFFLMLGMVMLACAVPAPTLSSAHAQGALVIAGGGVSDDNDAVYAAFLDALPAPDAPIAIIPAASGYPAGSAAAFAANLERRGVAPRRIRIIRLATEDDPDTSEDESAWRGGGEDEHEIVRLLDAGGIWFTGGDQARIMAALIRADGSDTGMLAMIRQRLAAGAVIGGTSAGAAIMSRMMIREGDPASLLPAAPADAEPVRTGAGLGFLGRHVVDQHFGERARLLRLIAVLGALEGAQRTGLGIDEDTALVIAPGYASATVAGRGLVSVVDGRAARFDRGAGLAVRGIGLALLGAGDRLDLQSLAVTPDPARAAAAILPSGAVPACLSAPGGSAAARSQSRIIAQVARALPRSITARCVTATGASGLALRLGWSDGAAIYTRSDNDSAPAITGLTLDVVPVTIVEDAARLDR